MTSASAACSRITKSVRVGCARWHSAKNPEATGGAKSAGVSGYVLVPSSIVEDPEHVRAWLQRAFDYAAGLPPKVKKPPKPKKAAR